MPPRPHPLLHLPLLFWPVKAFSPVLRDIPHYNRTPSLKVDHKRKLKPIPDQEYISQEEIYKQNVEPALNLLLTHSRAKKRYVSLICTWSYSDLLSSRNTNREWKVQWLNINFMIIIFHDEIFLFSVHILFGFIHTLNWRHREKCFWLKRKFPLKSLIVMPEAQPRHLIREKWNFTPLCSGDSLIS